MSLGDLVISLSCNTATLQSDLGKANQVVERVMASIIRDAKGAERAIDQLNKTGLGISQWANQAGPATDRLQRSFNSLNIKSALQIENEKRNVIQAFEQIKNSGVASASEVKRAYKAMEEQIHAIETGNQHAHASFDAFSIKGLAALAKIQIAYQGVNLALSTIFDLPKQAIQSIDEYNSSAVKTAALLVSFNAKKGNIAEQFKQAKEYAFGLQDAMIEIDRNSVASTKQLQLMNLELQKAHIFLNPGNRNQVEGFTALSNAVAVIAQGSQNPDMQFSQETRSMLTGEDKAGNVLLGILKSMDPEFEKHLEHWKKSKTELEEIGNLLVGFKAASGDIESLWSTISSTFSSLYDEVIRDGMRVAFQAMVSGAKQFNEWITQNREVLSTGIHKTLMLIKGVWDSIVIVVKGFAPVLAPIGSLTLKILDGWGFIGAVALPTVIEKFMGLVKIGGHIVMMVGMISGAFISFIGSLGTGIVALGKAAFQALTGDFAGAGKTLGSAFEGKFSDTIKGMAEGVRGALDSVKEEGNKFLNTDSFWKRFDDYKKVIEKSKAIVPPDTDPAPGKKKKDKAESVSNYNEIVSMFNQMQIKAEPDELASKLLAIDTQFVDLMVKFNAETDKAALKQQGITLETINLLQAQVQDHVKSDYYTKAAIEDQKAILNALKLTQGMRESEIADKIALVNHEEALNRISGPEATKRKVELTEELLKTQKQYLGLLSGPGMEAAWIAQQKQIVKTQQEIEKLNKSLYDRTAMGGLENFMRSLQDTTSNTGEQIKSVLTNAFNSSTDALMNFVETGKMGFADLTKSILKDIARIQIQKALAGIAGNIFSGFQTTFAQPTEAWNGVSAGNAGAPAWQGFSFDVGTDYVPKDMLAMVHKGEKIVPAAYNKNDSVGEMKIEIINQSGQSVKGRDAGTKFDGKSFVKTIILEAMDTDWSFRNAVRG